jgi:predicted GIY-YIG superfamily endonuclease
VTTPVGKYSKALLTIDEVRDAVGVSKQAVLDAIGRGDLLEVQMAGARGSVHKLITAASVKAWVNKLNGTTEALDGSQRLIAELESRIAAVSTQLSLLRDSVDLALGRMVGQTERDRRVRLRYTVSARIGDAFDPHGFYVYLLWGADDETPLYIGQSRNILSRLGSHMANNDRRYAVKSVQVIKCSGEATMKRTEAALIREYNPPLNVAGCVARLVHERTPLNRTAIGSSPAL